eukprot:1139344-Pyramimonas_sp.AAC.1
MHPLRCRGARRRSGRRMRGGRHSGSAFSLRRRRGASGAPASTAASLSARSSCLRWSARLPRGTTINN